MASYSDLKEKRKQALIAVCTLGLSAQTKKTWSVLFSTYKDADKGMSFQGTVFGYIFKIFSFIIWTLSTTLILWVINIFKLIYSIIGTFSEIVICVLAVERYQIHMAQRTF